MGWGRLPCFWSKAGGIGTKLLGLAHHVAETSSEGATCMGIFSSASPLERCQDVSNLLSGFVDDLVYFFHIFISPAW